MLSDYKLAVYIITFGKYLTMKEHFAAVYFNMYYYKQI